MCTYNITTYMNHLYFLYFTYNELLQSTKKHKVKVPKILSE